MTTSMTAEDIRATVRQSYGEVARSKPTNTGCCTGATGCCAIPGNAADLASRRMGYSPEELASLPEGDNLGL